VVGHGLAQGRGDLGREQLQLAGRVLGRPLNQIEVPDTIQGVLSARIDRLSETHKGSVKFCV
jgi:hypothetical protein